MNTLLTRQTSPRIASLNPFDIGAGAPPVCRTRATSAECRGSARNVQIEAFKGVEEFGCVDWYQYPGTQAIQSRFIGDR